MDVHITQVLGWMRIHYTQIIGRSIDSYVHNPIRYDSVLTTLLVKL